MRIPPNALPDAMPSPETEQVLMRGVRPFAASCKGETLPIERPDDDPDGGGEGGHVGDDMSVVDDALRILKEKIDRVPKPATNCRIRTKLKLSHRQAGALLRGGASTFDKDGWGWRSRADRRSSSSGSSTGIPSSPTNCGREMLMPNWPKDKLLQHGPDLPMAERIRRYQHSIRTIHTSGCAVPTSAYIDTLDPVAIEMWFHDNAERRHRLKAVVQGLAALPPEPGTD